MVSKFKQMSITNGNTEQHLDEKRACSAQEIDRKGKTIANNLQHHESRIRKESKLFSHFLIYYFKLLISIFMP